MRCAILITCALFLLLPISASAVRFPNPTCPDSVSIAQIQDVTSRCAPAVNDTVLGVGGIIIGFDPIATGFNIHLQNSQGGPFSGIDMFTGTINTKAAPYNFAIGDSIVVEYAKKGEFQNNTQILAPNGSTSAPNWIIRKVSSGNALPPFFVGTTTQLRETPTNTVAEQYEGGLVQINGPLTVVRTSLTGGLGTNNGFLVIDPAAPSDSVFINGNKLTTYAPPPLGTIINSVQGIMAQETRGYRIWLRGPEDITLGSRPALKLAFALSDSIVLVRFDRAVLPSTATDVTNYLLMSSRTIQSISTDGLDGVRLLLGGSATSGLPDSLTVRRIATLETQTPMAEPQSVAFVHGELTPALVQQPDAATLTTFPCVDRSRFAGLGGSTNEGALGMFVSLRGTVSARFGSVYYLTDASGALRSGLAVTLPSTTIQALSVGRRYRLAGRVQEFFGETRLSEVVYLEDIGAGEPLSPFASSVQQCRLDACDLEGLLTTGEDLEGMLVLLPTVRVIAPVTSAGFRALSPTLADTIWVENLHNTLPSFSIADGVYVSVAGHLRYEPEGGFRIAPRSLADITSNAVLSTTGAGGSIERTPNLPAYPIGARVQLRAEPDSAHYFVRWAGAISSISNPLIFNITESITISAVFDTLRSFTIASTPSGQVERSPAAAFYRPGQQVSLTAIPDSACYFESWSGSISSSFNPFTYTIRGDSLNRIIANFDSLGFTVRDSAVGMGQINRSRVRRFYTLGSPLRLYPVPSMGHRFIGWSGDTTTTSDTLDLEVRRDFAVTATFVIDDMDAPRDVTAGDVPSDQGGQLSLNWVASRLELKSPGSICCYDIQRRHDSHPDSAWGTIRRVPASGSTTYQLTLATPADSTNASPARYRYRVTALSTNLQSAWPSLEVTGYSVDNIPPPATTSVSGVISSGLASMFWQPVQASDLMEYRIYRGNEPQFPPTQSNRVGITTATNFFDQPGRFAHYKVTAVDVHGNESTPTLFLPLNNADASSPPPLALTVGPNTPSPTRARTQIRLGLPKADFVDAWVMDLAGRRIASIASDRLESGWHVLEWDGRRHGGEEASPGVYLVQIRVRGHGEWTRRVVKM